MTLKGFLYWMCFQFFGAIAMVLVIPSFNEFYYAGNKLGLALSVVSVVLGIGAFYISNRI